MNEELYDLLEECQMVLSAVVVEAESQHAPNAAMLLAEIIQCIGRLEDMAEHEGVFDPDDPVGNIIGAVIPKKEVRKPIAFADIHPEVLEAVYSACDSAEDQNLSEWEIDLIASRIVKNHHGARLLSANDLKDTDD